MRFSQALIGALSATCAFANTVTFTNLDGIAKTLYFTGNGGMGSAPATLALAPHAKATWSTNEPWAGNFYSVNEGAANVPGMLGEVNFADANMVWYDVSAIVNSNDNAGVKQLSASPSDPVSGCLSYATRCNNAYNLPNDIQTKSTTSRDLYCTVGTSSASKLVKVRGHARDFMAKVRAAI